MDCTGLHRKGGRACCPASLTVRIWRVVAGHEFVMIDSGHEVVDLSEQVGRGFGRCPLSLGWVAGLRRASSGEPARR